MNNIESVFNTINELNCVRVCKILSGEDFIKLSEQITRNHSTPPITYNWATYITPKNDYYEYDSKISIISTNKKRNALQTRAINLEKAHTILRDSRWLELFNFNKRIKLFIEEKSRKYNLWFMFEKKEMRLKMYIARDIKKFYACLPIRYDRRDSNYQRLKDFYFNSDLNSKIKGFAYYFVSTISKT